MRTKQNYQILTFHTTTAAMAMEDYCHEQKFPGNMEITVTYTIEDDDTLHIVSNGKAAHAAGRV